MAATRYPACTFFLFDRFLTCYNKLLTLQGVTAVPEINQHGQTVNDIVPDWKCARALTRTPLTGQYCRLEPLDAERHAADLFEAYALGDDSDWTWLASTQPVSVEATAHWVLGRCWMTTWCPLPLSICAPKRR